MSTDSRIVFIRKQAITALELLKGLSPEQMNNSNETVEEFSDYILELTQTLSNIDTNIQGRILELKELKKGMNLRKDNCKGYEVIIKILDLMIDDYDVELVFLRGLSSIISRS